MPGTEASLQGHGAEAGRVDFRVKPYLEAAWNGEQWVGSGQGSCASPGFTLEEGF